MADLPIAHQICAAGHWRGTADRVVLSYDARFLRRKRLETEGGISFLADLPETVSLAPGEAFQLDDARLIEIVAAEEPLLEITGAGLPRLAWHIGNRHAPCQIGADRLLIRRDRVLQAMLQQLGAQVAEISAAFVPEGGAYGMGRTLGHDHGLDAAREQGHGEAGHRHVHVHVSHLPGDQDHDGAHEPHGADAA